MQGVTLAETNLNFRREEQWFFSSEGANIHQTKYTTGAGYAAHAFAGSEIQKRSYPNSFGGQWQNKGYELIEELKLVENARRVGEEAVALLKADQCPEGVFNIILDSSQLGLADSRVGRTSHRTRPRAGHGSEFRRHVLSHARQAAHPALRQRPGEHRRRRAPGARPGPRHVRVRRRRRSRAMHADHHQRPVHRISEFARDRAHHRRQIAPAEPCAPRAGTGCPLSA